MTEHDIERAKAFCVAAHCAVGQRRKYTMEHYYHHPFAVAELLLQHVPGVSTEQVVAALLHDVVEDTQVTLQVVQEQFGDLVAMYVYYLTDVSPVVDPTASRARRKQLDREHVAKAPWDAKTIKLADLIHNTASIVQYAPEFAKVYLEEKRLLLEVLVEADQAMYALAQKTLADALQSIAKP